MGQSSMTLTSSDYDRIRPLCDGSIQPEGLDLISRTLSWSLLTQLGEEAARPERMRYKSLVN
jgi:hypothetical protein